MSGARLCGLSPGTAYGPSCIALERALASERPSSSTSSGAVPVHGAPPPLSVCTGGRGDGGARTNKSDNLLKIEYEFAIYLVYRTRLTSPFATSTCLGGYAQSAY